MALTVQAQARFMTMLPQQPVVAGEAFRLQYVLTGGERNALIEPPVFRGVKVIEGPVLYHGSEGLQPVTNFVYTLVAPVPGKLELPGTAVLSGGSTYKSKAVAVEVISRKEAMDRLNKKGEPAYSEYTLRPGEDPYRKIRENLFVKVQLDKKHCRVGEPVQAIFKLYSRLESTSDIIRNPGFYGFTVYDVAGLSEKISGTEKINGRIFDVHTIRKVQLYPLQAGRFVVDPMEILNRVSFSHSAVSRKTEQQIAEGMMGIGDEVQPAPGTELFETRMQTDAVEVVVNPLPEKNQPADFNGAVGQFTIRADTPHTRLARNEQGWLEISLDGKGNFTQISAPVLQWPAGVEGFEPTLADDLDKNHIPLKGRRVFRFPFVCGAPGTYVLPAVQFSYFDTDSNRYKTIRTNPLTIISGSELKKQESLVSGKKGSLEASNEKAARTGGIIAVVLVLGVLAYWIFGAREKKQDPATEKVVPVLVSVSEVLAPLKDLAAAEPRIFYSALQSAVWEVLATRFGLSGSEMNKTALAAAVEIRTGNAALAVRLTSLLEICETGAYTGANLVPEQSQLLQETETVLEQTIAAADKIR